MKSNKRHKKDRGIYKCHTSYQVRIEKNYILYYGGIATDLNKARELKKKLLEKLNTLEKH